MTASPCDVVHSGRPAKTRHPAGCALAALCDARPDDEAQAGAVIGFDLFTRGRALYDGADGAGVLDDLSDETADHDPRPHVVDARGHLAKVRVAGSSPVVRSKKCWSQH
jgi:hypothetical protein